jgi:hypothetical protein
MTLSLGCVMPTEPGPPATGQPSCPQAPEGYWVNPDNCTQFLPRDQAKRIGDVCMFGTGLMPGRLRVGGNGPNTKLYCGCMFNSPQTDSLVFYGGAAAIAFFLLPKPYRYYVSVPLAAIATLGIVWGQSNS